MKLIETDWIIANRAMKNEFINMIREKDMKFYLIHGYPSGIERYKFGIIVPDDFNLPFYYISIQNSSYKRRKISFIEPRKEPENVLDGPGNSSGMIVSHRAKAGDIYGKNHIGTMEIFPIWEKYGDQRLVIGISVVYFFQNEEKDSIFCDFIEKRLMEIGVKFDQF